MLKNVTAQCKCFEKVVKDLSQESIESAETIINVQRAFLSEINLVANRSLLAIKSTSEPDIHYIANYDDICGPWPSSDHPSLQQYDDVSIKPILCAWKFITVQDMQYIHQNSYNKTAIQSIFEKRLSINLIFNDKSKNLYLSLTWEIFYFMRDARYSAKGISSVLGLFYLTHRFFLSNSWRSAIETFTFFKKGLDLHAFLKLPESDMVFNFFECDEILDTFWTLYISKLELIHLVSIPKYNVIFKIKNCNSSKNNKA